MDRVSIGDTVQVQVEVWSTSTSPDTPEVYCQWVDAVVWAICGARRTVTVQLPWGEIRAYCEGQYRRKEG